MDSVYHHILRVQEKERHVMNLLPSDKWNRRNTAHLLVRAGFGATPEQIDAAEKRPMAEVVDSLFAGDTDANPPDWVIPGVEKRPDFRALRELPDEERRRIQMETRQEENRRHRELTAWWIRRMINSPCPLREKMVLFWHGHFATSIRKVRSAYMMYLQNETFRQKGMGSVRELVTAVAQDPAMLVYLDNTRSRAGSPNENFARELMELFTLGEGHYTEQDIKEASRAFTGWMLAPREFVFRDAASGPRSRLHDSGNKIFFGQEGSFDGHDIIRIILEQEQAYRFMVERIWSFFAYENPEPELIDQLTNNFRQSGGDLTPLLKTIFTSRAFYSERALRTQIKSPTQWLVGSCMVLDLKDPEAGLCFNILRTLGQELFAPPNVKGWDGGYAWITTSTLTQRYNLAARLINTGSKKPGSDDKPSAGNRVEGIFPKEKRGTSDAVRTYLEDRIYQTRLTSEDENQVIAFLETLPPPQKWDNTQIRNVFKVMMSTPQYQLT